MNEKIPIMKTVKQLLSEFEDLLLKRSSATAEESSTVLLRLLNYTHNDNGNILTIHDFEDFDCNLLKTIFNNYFNFLIRGLKAAGHYKPDLDVVDELNAESVLLQMEKINRE